MGFLPIHSFIIFLCLFVHFLREPITYFIKSTWYFNFIKSTCYFNRKWRV